MTYHRFQHIVLAALAAIVGLPLLVAAIVALPFAGRSTALPPASQPAPVPSTTPVQHPWCPPGLAPHNYADNPVDAKLAGPGSVYKAKPNDFGPYPLAVNIDRLRRGSPMVEVKAAFIHDHCVFKKLLQVSYMGLDVDFLAMSPTDPRMNPNTSISDAVWRERTETYLDAIDWDKSYLKKEVLPAGVWSDMMLPRRGREPVVKVAQHQLPAPSHILVLAVRQPDGSLRYEEKRIDCLWQTIYRKWEAIPPVLRP